LPEDPVVRGLDGPQEGSATWSLRTQQCAWPPPASREGSTPAEAGCTDRV